MTTNRDLELLISFLAPIRSLLLDETVTEIMGNPNGMWWCERKGRILSVDITFEAKALAVGLEVIANKLNRKFDSKHPILNVQLPDGSRLAAVLPPVVRPYPAVTIRKFSNVRLTLQDLVNQRSLPALVASDLKQVIENGKTLLISGGTGSGKTTLLNALADFIPNEERIVVIEDTSELRIGKANVLAAECQTEAHAGAVHFNDLLRAALRWRPDRIILGEVRGDEARTLLDSFNTGHAGSMATIHASSPVKALRRFAELAMRTHQQSSFDEVATEISESVDSVLQVCRSPDGRKVSEIIDVRGYDRVNKMFLYDVVFQMNKPE